MYVIYSVFGPAING